MNKQELIDELKRISLEKQHKALTHPESKNYYEGMVMAYSQVVHMVNTVLKLDEPQKPVVPKFVAEWFEENKDDLEFPIWELCVDSYGSKDEHGMLNWIQQSENNPIETLIRMKDGYEVEKSRWVVNEGDLVIRKGEHEAKVYFVESVDDGILLVNGSKDEFFTDLDDRSVDEESINYFYENFRLLAKKENLEAEKVEV
ncbi:DUF1642 domain-containing protein [Enterococcus faecium]|nr:DUF1642 domain-containing protein [Enterococcus faecium]EGP5414950.1 DUF1642 domain-containing protein [Enterococcus faecium]